MFLREKRPPEPLEGVLYKEHGETLEGYLTPSSSVNGICIDSLMGDYTP